MSEEEDIQELDESVMREEDDVSTNDDKTLQSEVPTE